jgi:hypothetical protein
VVAKTKDVKRTIVHLKIMFFDNENSVIPFYIVNGDFGADGSKKIPLSEKIFWITLKELKKEKMLI